MSEGARNTFSLKMHCFEGVRPFIRPPVTEMICELSSGSSDLIIYNSSRLLERACELCVVALGVAR